MHLHQVRNIHQSRILYLTFCLESSSLPRPGTCFLIDHRELRSNTGPNTCYKPIYLAYTGCTERRGHHSYTACDVYKYHEIKAFCEEEWSCDSYSWVINNKKDETKNKKICIVYKSSLHWSHIHTSKKLALLFWLTGGTSLSNTGSIESHARRLPVSPSTSYALVMQVK